MDLSGAITQQQFGELVGVSQQAVSDLVGRGVLTPGDTASEWLDCKTEAAKTLRHPCRPL